MSKRTNPLVAALFGILLIPGSLCLQAWNEYRTIHRTRGLEEAAQIVVSLPDPEIVQTELEGKLVHLSGQAYTTEILRDPNFGVEQNAISIRRRVEMYQWQETEKSKDGRKTYNYKQVWKEGRIDSDQFDQSGYGNPFPAFESWSSTAKGVLVGKYELSDSLKSQKNDAVPTAIDAEAIQKALGQNEGSGFRSEGNHLYYSNRTGNTSPEIGDLRIFFEHVPNGPVSLMAALHGNTFASYSTKNGEPIDQLYPGILKAEQMIDKLKSENMMIAWLLRGLGFILCLVGMLMIFSPAQALFKWIPLVGDIAGGLLFLVSCLIALVLTMVTIAVSWIVVRPILAISLLAIAGIAIYLLLRTNRRVHQSHHSQEPLMLTDDMMVS